MAEPACFECTLVDAPEGDLREPECAARIVGNPAPDAVLHLAGQTWVPDAFRDPAATIEINVLGTLNLLQALRRAGFRGRMVYVGTGDVYGRVSDLQLPVQETCLPAPRNPYAVSKLAAEALCRQWSMTEAMEIVLARPFNHIGWGQSERFVISDFAHQIASIRQRRRDPVVSVGDIDVTRDFTDVRDVVRAYFALLESGETGEIYNVCSGRERSIRSLLLRLAELAGVDVAVEQDPARLRKSEQTRMVGSPAKLHAATGWQARTPIDESLAAMLRYWEEQDRA